MFRFLSFFPFFVFSLLACNMQNTEKTSSKENINDHHAIKKDPVAFNGDSAYNFVKAQVAFGPRVPNTSAHISCGDYLRDKLKTFGATVTEQLAELKAYDNSILKARNIIGSFLPEANDRILLCAHWDSRPYADNDTDPSNHKTPISGANDGASGVGVLLEIARQLQQKLPSVGVDIIFFDAEDYGTPYFHEGKSDSETTWCLGSQYWAANPHVPNYKAEFGILLDMVGAPSANFYKEGYSMQMAPHIVEKVWSKAFSMGKGGLFINGSGGTITDDHLFVMKGRNFPCIDIIDFNPYTTGFGPYWHTIHDTMDAVDKETLKSVGEVVLSIIYEQQPKQK